MCVVEKGERKAYMCGGACNPALVRTPEGDFGCPDFTLLL